MQEDLQGLNGVQVFEEGTLESRDSGATYKIAEMGGYLAFGRNAKVSAWSWQQPLTPKALYPHLPEGISTMSTDPSKDVVVDVRPVVVYVNWEVLNQMLPISEQDSYPKPPPLWTGPELQKLTHLGMLHTAPPPVDTTVIFKDELDDSCKSPLGLTKLISVYGLVPTRHVRNQFIVRAMRITACRSVVTVRWQDGHISQEAGTSIVPYTNVDEWVYSLSHQTDLSYDAWPGEHVNWRGDSGELRPSVIQTFDAHQRTAEVLFLDTKVSIGGRTTLK